MIEASTTLSLFVPYTRRSLSTQPPYLSGIIAQVPDWWAKVAVSAPCSSSASMISSSVWAATPGVTSAGEKRARMGFCQWRRVHLTASIIMVLSAGFWKVLNCTMGLPVGSLAFRATNPRESGRWMAAMANPNAFIGISTATASVPERSSAVMDLAAL